MKRMNAGQLSANFRAAAILLDTISAIATDPVGFLLNDETDVTVAELPSLKLHWTQRPENQAKLRRMHRRTARKLKATRNRSLNKLKASTKQLKAKNVLHWTQRPKNREKVIKMNRASARKRLAIAS